MFGANRQGIFNQYRWLITRIQLLFDGAVVLALLVLLCWLYAVSISTDYLFLGVATFLLTIVVFQGARLYQPWRGVYLGRLVRKTFLAWAVVIAILAVLGYGTKTSIIFSRRVIFSWLVLTPIALVALRLQIYLGLRWARERGHNSRRVVIAGAGKLGQRLAKNVLDTPWLGMRLLGFFDDCLKGEEIELYPGAKAYPVLGTLDDLVDFVQDYTIDMVYLALPLRAEARLSEVIVALQDTTASVYFVPDIFTLSLLQAFPTELKGIPLISICESPFHGINGWLKRVEDIVLSSIILLLISPLMLFIAIGVKLTSPGPIIFKQRRYGLNGKEIIVYKFRTMMVCDDGSEIPQAIQNDSRVTPFGRFLRRTSLDELPQFLNVLSGTMSIVGPRPHAVSHNEFYRQRIPGYMLRHKVRPGITGLAQINGWRGETNALEKMEKRIEYDLDYLRRWSLWFDLKIILLTPFQILKGQNAY